MHDNNYWLLIAYILFLVICLLAWIFRWNIIHLRRRTYKDLVEEREMLQQSVWDWRYPDGTFVPQHKRQRMFGELQQLSRKIYKHPDNPENQDKQ